MLPPRFSTTAIAIGLLASCGASTAEAALVLGDTITTTFISGGWSLSLTLSPSSPMTIGSGVEATFTGTQNFFLAPGNATYTFDFFNDSNGRAFVEMTAAFSTNPSSPPTIGSNFSIGSLDFGPGFQLGSVVPVLGSAGINSVTGTGFAFSASSIVISSTPQTIRMELIPVAVPEPATNVSIGLLGAALFIRRRR